MRTHKHTCARTHTFRHVHLLTNTHTHARTQQDRCRLCVRVCVCVCVQGSMHALVASPYKAAYNAAKHGVAGFTKVRRISALPHLLGARLGARPGTKTALPIMLGARVVFVRACVHVYMCVCVRPRARCQK